MRVAILLLFLSISLVSTEYSVGGSGNNLNNPEWGSNGQPLLRLSYGYAYDDGVSEPRGNATGLVSPREISNAVHDLLENNSPITARDLSDYLTVWGQFVDHDIDVSGTNCSESYPIPVPANDPFFNPTADTDLTLPLCRSTHISGSFPRDQFNEISAWLDGSVVYGPTQEWSDNLRSFSNGQLATIMIDGKEFPIYNDDGNGNPLVGMANVAARVPATELFAVGDKRGNENPLLLALHVLFVREHNRIANEATGNDEEKYQYARKMVTAFIQSITYYEYLPTLFDRDIEAYTGYDDTVNGDIDAFFSGASFRYGHSEVRMDVKRRGSDWEEHPAGDLSLFKGYFYPKATTSEGIEPLLRGALVAKQHEVDGFITGALRNDLFGLHKTLTVAGHATDLFSINIQRAREHGIPGYNDLRAAFGLSTCGPSDFECVAADANVAAVLSTLYSSTDEIDGWVAGLVEEHTDGNLGGLFAASLEDQFVRIRNGDRFYFEGNSDFTTEELNEALGTRLSHIIERNTDIESVPEDVFVRYETIPLDMCLCDRAARIKLALPELKKLVCCS